MVDQPCPVLEPYEKCINVPTLLLVLLLQNPVPFYCTLNVKSQVFTSKQTRVDTTDSVRPKDVDAVSTPPPFLWHVRRRGFYKRETGKGLTNGWRQAVDLPSYPGQAAIGDNCKLAQRKGRKHTLTVRQTKTPALDDVRAARQTYSEGPPIPTRASTCVTPHRTYVTPESSLDTTRPVTVTTTHGPEVRV